MLKIISVMLVLAVVFSVHVSADPAQEDVLAAMKKSAEFMVNSVSNKGGFLWKYSSDLSVKWGEVPARETMIWVQDPGTVGVGSMFLDAYLATGETQYLEYAQNAANALIWGQHPSGGWHYFIDFDMTGVRQFYDDVYSKCWGWEEYNHYYGNCTYDDDVTTGAAKFMLEIYMATLNPAYRVSVLSALDFILESQYPNGAWPQRYPLKHDYPHNGHPDYTSYYTYNDNVIQGNIYFLLEAWEKLGNEEYKNAAYRGMDFLIISQLAEPQAGWGQQYDMEMRSAAARSYEPASVMPGQTRRCIRDLQTFYKISGDRRYLAGIPAAIKWLELSYLPADHKSNERVTHATFYELGTNKPLYAHREGTSIETGRYWIDYEPRNFPGHYGMQTRIDVAGIKKEFDRVSALTPEQAMAEYRDQRARSGRARRVNAETVTKLIDTMDDRGIWLEDVRFPDIVDAVNTPATIMEGISTRTFILNMRTLINYLRYLNEK
ncbi:pectate lyase [Candidatus Latescibacterota bacterium]